MPIDKEKNDQSNTMPAVKITVFDSANFPDALSSKKTNIEFPDISMEEISNTKADPGFPDISMEPTFEFPDIPMNESASQKIAHSLPVATTEKSAKSHVRSSSKKDVRSLSVLGTEQAAKSWVRDSAVSNYSGRLPEPDFPDDEHP